MDSKQTFGRRRLKLQANTKMNIRERVRDSDRLIEIVSSTGHWYIATLPLVFR